MFKQLYNLFKKRNKNVINELDPVIDEPIIEVVESVKLHVEDVTPPEPIDHNLDDLLSYTPTVKIEKDPDIGTPKYFEKYMDGMRNHQNEALDAIDGESIGQIILPTGVGKSRIQIATHIKDMLSNTKSGVYVIASHRLVLNGQLLTEFADVAINSGVKFDIVLVGSDRVDNTEFMAKHAKNGVYAGDVKITSTTSGSDLLNTYNKAMQNNRHLIIVSTYHSFNRMVIIPKINICTYDEAHTTINIGFVENINEVKPNINNEYFFTATRKVGDVVEDYDYMDDEVFYGKLLYTKSPRYMMEVGEITTPKIITLNPVETDNKYDNYTQLGVTIRNGYDELAKCIEKYSCTPNMMGVKLLVTFNSVQEMENVYKDQLFKDWRKQSNIDIHRLSSEHGCYNNDVLNTRTLFMKTIRDIPDIDNIILFHVDTLAEGIDLPSINGVMVLRNVSVSKFGQTMGRAARLLSSDRKGLYSGVIKPMEYHKMIKPHFWVIFSEDLFTEDKQNKKFTSYIKYIRDNYNVYEETYKTTEAFNADEDLTIDPITPRDVGVPNNNTCDINAIVEVLEYDELMVDIRTAIDSVNNAETKSEQYTKVFKHLGV